MNTSKNVNEGSKHVRGNRAIYLIAFDRQRGSSHARCLGEWWPVTATAYPTNSDPIVYVAGTIYLVYALLRILPATLFINGEAHRLI